MGIADHMRNDCNCTYHHWDKDALGNYEFTAEANFSPAGFFLPYLMRNY